MAPHTPSAGHVKSEYKEVLYVKTESHVVFGILPKVLLETRVLPRNSL